MIRNNRFGSVVASILVLLLLLVVTACNGTPSDKAQTGKTSESGKSSVSGTTTASSGTTQTVKAVEKKSGGSTLTPAEATVGPREESAMPASGIKKARSHPPTKTPPKGVRTFPATSNKNVSGKIDYPREPPTNGDHAPIWQNCGFYKEPVKNETAVHSLDHGAVWISYRPNLPTSQLDVLRKLAKERYVLVSLYPGQPAPVIVTAWRNQIRLQNANDPRLKQFVKQFRLSDTAPRAGNGCVFGVGKPGS